MSKSPASAESAEITFVITCMGRLQHLRETLPQTLRQSRSRVVVVDYSCPDDTAAWLRDAHSDCMTLDIVRVPDQTHFNLARARNRGAEAVRTPWLFFLDADMILTRDVWTELHDRLDPSTAFRGPPLPNVGGQLLVHRTAFDRIGGYDPRYHGWGFEDNDIHRAITAHGFSLEIFSETLFSPLLHDDDLRTGNYAEKNKRASALTNGLYLSTKWFLFGRFPENMKPTLLDLLYAHAANLRSDLLSSEDGQQCISRAWWGPLRS